MKIKYSSESLKLKNFDKKKFLPNHANKTNLSTNDHNRLTGSRTMSAFLCIITYIMIDYFIKMKARCGY